jgi:triacylglycerol esterase/lipase EstA (alpha/beta hydrolase family)
MPLPTIILPGYLASAMSYRDMEKNLVEQGFPTTVVPLVKRDWFPTLGGRSVLPILEALDRTVQDMRLKYNVERVNLIGHSAGGWISRIYLGEKPYDVHGFVDGKTHVWNAHDFVSSLITLGTPQISRESWTLKNLNFVNSMYPGAYYPQVAYTCVAGEAIYGSHRFESWLAYSSYKLTCGQGKCWGDGITPVAAAHLEGATNLILEDVWHYSNFRNLWYGTDTIVKRWAASLD